MTTVSAGAFEELCRRIRRSIGSGQTLYGMKFYEQFTERNEKADDLPRVYVTDYSDKEEHAGGVPTGSGAGNGINSIIRTIATVGLQLVVDRKNGWMTDSEVVTNIKKMGIINLKNLLIDEIEKNDDGVTDCSFTDSEGISALDQPPMFSVRESGIFDLGIVMDITVVMHGRRMNRATRSCLIAPAP